MKSGEASAFVGGGEEIGTHHSLIRNCLNVSFCCLIQSYLYHRACFINECPFLRLQLEV